MTEPQIDRLVAETFRLYDTNHDGVIDYKEYVRASICICIYICICVCICSSIFFFCCCVLAFSVISVASHSKRAGAVFLFVLMIVYDCYIRSFQVSMCELNPTILRPLTLHVGDIIANAKAAALAAEQAASSPSPVKK